MHSTCPLNSGLGLYHDPSRRTLKTRLPYQLPASILRQTVRMSTHSFLGNNLPTLPGNIEAMLHKAVCTELLMSTWLKGDMQTRPTCETLQIGSLLGLAKPVQTIRPAILRAQERL